MLSSYSATGPVAACLRRRAVFVLHSSFGWRVRQLVRAMAVGAPSAILRHR
jgi:hypothetical protein